MSKYIIITKQAGTGFISLPKEWNCPTGLELVSSEKKLTKMLSGNADVREIKIPQEPQRKTDGTSQFPKHIFIRNNDRFRKTMFRDILFIEASGSYCCIHLASGKEIFLSMNLSRISEQLSPRQFARVHRSYVVNMEHVDSLDGNILYIARHRIPISRRHMDEVRGSLNVLTGCHRNGAPD